MNPSKFTHATKEEKIQQFDPYEEQGGRGEEKSEEEAHIDERNRCFTMLREREISQNSHPRKKSQAKMRGEATAERASYSCSTPEKCHGWKRLEKKG